MRVLGYEFAAVSFGMSFQNKRRGSYYSGSFRRVEAVRM
jgi:hypothetical protein